VTESNSFEMAHAITTEYCKGCDPSGVQYALERVFVKHEAATKEYKTTISRLRQALTGLRKELQAVYDEQKGAPKNPARKRLERAMKLAEAALSPEGN
jgi:hypothetical protein